MNRDANTPTPPPADALCAVPRCRQKFIRTLFRWLLLAHAILLRVVRWLPRRRLRNGKPRSILLTGTFFSENWIMNHLSPLAGSTACSGVTVVSIFPIPSTPKVEWIAPPSWLCRAIGETPARLLVFALIALRRRPDFIGGFHLIPNGLVSAVIARLVGAHSLHICGGGPREVLGGGTLGVRALAGVAACDPVAEARLLRAMNAIDVVVCMGARSVEF